MAADGEAGGAVHVSAVYERSFAVLIGVNKYKDDEIPNLTTAVTNVGLMEAALGRHDFVVVSKLTDEQATLRNIRRVLFSQLTYEIGDVGTDDRLVVYFCGHSADGYLLPSDCEAEMRAGTSLHLQSLRHELLERIPVRHVLFVLETHMADDTLAAISLPHSVAVATSGRLPDKTLMKAAAQIVCAHTGSPAPAEENPVFTQMISAALGGGAFKSSRGWITADELFEWVAERVSAESNGAVHVCNRRLLPGDGNCVFVHPKGIDQRAGGKVFLMAYPRPGLLMGRGYILEKMRKLLMTAGRTTDAAAEHGPMVVLKPTAWVPKGVCGVVGKTMTAVEYAYKHKPAYAAVLFVSADSREAMRWSFVECAEELGIVPEHSPVDKSIAAVRAWLAERRGWLLIVDGVIDVPMVREFLPTQWRGHVVVTTSEPNVAPLGVHMQNVIDIDVLTREEGATLLLTKAGSAVEDMGEEERHAAAELSRLVHYAPMVLELLGSYVKRKGCTFGALLAALRETKGNTVPLMRKLWEMSEELLSHKFQAAIQMLRVMAHLKADAPLPVSAFTVARRVFDGRELGLVLSDALRLEEVVRTLLSFALVKRNRHEGTLLMHPLVQRVVLTGLSDEKIHSYAVLTVRMMNKAFSKGVTCMLVPHGHTAMQLVTEHELTMGEAVRMLSKLGDHMGARREYAFMQTIDELLLRMDTLKHGEVSQPVATRLSNLAMTLWKQGKCEAAVPYARRAVNVGKDVLKEEHPHVARYMALLANICRDMEQYADAKVLYKRAIAIGEEALGSRHPEVGVWLNNMASLYISQAMWDDALPLLRRAVTIGEKHIPEHVYNAMWCCNLANVLTHTGEYHEAQGLYLRAISILPPQHPELPAYKALYAEMKRIQREGVQEEGVEDSEVELQMESEASELESEA